MIQFCDNDVPVLWTRFMDKHHVVRVRKPPGFGLKYLFWSPQTRLEIVTRSLNYDYKYPVMSRDKSQSGTVALLVPYQLKILINAHYSMWSDSHTIQ